MPCRVTTSATCRSVDAAGRARRLRKDNPRLVRSPTVTENKNAPRMLWMDQLRGIAIVLVLLQHTNAIAGLSGLEQWPVLEWFNSLFAPYRMPTLLFLSGILLTPSLHKPLREYASGKIRKILWPLAVWSIPTIALLQPSSLKAMAGPGHLWFLYVLLACYAIGLLTKWIPAIVVAAMLFACAIFVSFDASLLEHIPRARMIAWYGGFFFIGVASMKVVPWWQKNAPWWVATSLGVVAVAWGLVPGTKSNGSLTPFEFPMSLIGIAAIVWVAPRLPVFPQLVQVGKDSIVWYVSQSPVMRIIAPLLPTALPGWAAAITLFALATLTCWLLLLLRRWGVASILYEFPRLRQRDRAATSTTA